MDALFQASQDLQRAVNDACNDHMETVRPEINRRNFLWLGIQWAAFKGHSCVTLQGFRLADFVVPALSDIHKSPVAHGLCGDFRVEHTGCSVLYQSLWLLLCH